MDPATLMALGAGAGSAAGAVLGAGKGKHDYAAARRETFAAFPGYFDMLQRLGMPQLNLALNQASLQGSKIGQDVSSALGSLGGGSTGVGAITRSMAAGASGQLQSQVRLNFLQQLMDQALNMLSVNLQAGMGKG